MLDERKKRYYVAVDDGKSPRVRAFVVEPDLYRQLEQGRLVEATVTRHLRYVRGISDV